MRGRDLDYKVLVRGRGIRLRTEMDRLQLLVSGRGSDYKLLVSGGVFRLHTSYEKLCGQGF